MVEVLAAYPEALAAAGMIAVCLVAYYAYSVFTPPKSIFQKPIHHEEIKSFRRMR